jgi:hypothetical protein
LSSFRFAGVVCAGQVSAGETGGRVPDPVAERFLVPVAEFGVVVVAEEAGPGGDVRRDDSSCVDLPGLRRVGRPDDLDHLGYRAGLARSCG